MSQSQPQQLKRNALMRSQGVNFAHGLGFHAPLKRFARLAVGWKGLSVDRNTTELDLGRWT